MTMNSSDCRDNEPDVGKASCNSSPARQEEGAHSKGSRRQHAGTTQRDCVKRSQHDSRKCGSMSPVREDCSVPGKACWRIWHSRFEVDEVYRPIRVVGKGAYGVVCSAENTVTGEKVAIKKIANAFDNPTDALRSLRELQLLRNLRHFNIVSIKDVIKPHDRSGFKDVYIVYELLDTDLHQIIKSKQPLSNEHLQFFTYQVLRALKFMHSANVLHRDLKPSNLLLTAGCDLKICDFGLSRTGGEAGCSMTEYVVTRWYRAPELLLSCEQYTSAIDMWSVGCILAEMLGRVALFPGSDYMDMLRRIVATLGSPSEEALAHVTSERAGATRTYVRELPPARRADFCDMFPEADLLAVDLMERLLQFDPRQRLTAEQALAHPWLAELHDEPTEPAAAGRFEFDFDEEALTEQAIKDLVYREAQMYHPSQKS